MARLRKHSWLVALFGLLFQLASCHVMREGYQDRVDVQVNDNVKEEEQATLGQKTTTGCLSLPSVELLDKIAFGLHHNGEVQACDQVQSSVERLEQAVRTVTGGNCDPKAPFSDGDSYVTEAILSQFFLLSASQSSCGSTDNSTAVVGLAGYCDMGPERTVVQFDHDRLVPVSDNNRNQQHLPCRFFTREGWQIESIQQLIDMSSQKLQAMDECVASDATDDNASEEAPTCPSSAVLDLYAVPAGRVFMFAPAYVGETFVLDHLNVDVPITMTVLSVEPRVFDIHNFFSDAESDALITKALGETSETHKFHRSTTGSVGASVFKKRTSENAWDTHGKTALAIKKRCFDFLGMPQYMDEYADGLQILRYNLTTAYTPHMDYLSDVPAEAYDYQTAGKGGNRFATILLYMTDLEPGDGGETVFAEAWPSDTENRVPLKEAIQQLRDSGDAPNLKKGSWEEEMTALCRTRLSVRPQKSRAVLFYSQHPNGEEDLSSKHGGCPVLRGTKLAANLWTWSGIRPEFEGAPLKRELTEEEKRKGNPQQLKATFTNTGKDPAFDRAELYYDESGFFGKLTKGTPISVNTYEGHVWNIMVDGRKLKTFVIGKDAIQAFTV